MMRVLMVMCALTLLGAAVVRAAEEPKVEQAAVAQRNAEVRVAANRRAMRRRVEDLRNAVALSDYELIRRFRARDDALLLALVNREFRAAAKLLLSLADSDIERLLSGGTIERKTESLDQRQLFLARLAAGVDDPALLDVSEVSFAGVDDGEIVFRWVPDAGTVARAGPPAPERYRFVLIPAGREVEPEYRDILRTELRRTPYQGLLPKR
jgi:hypothetical protein